MDIGFYMVIFDIFVNFIAYTFANRYPYIYDQIKWQTYLRVCAAFSCLLYFYTHYSTLAQTISFINVCSYFPTMISYAYLLNFLRQTMIRGWFLSWFYCYIFNLIVLMYYLFHLNLILLMIIYKFHNIRFFV